MDDLYAIRIKGIWAYLKSQDVLFWLINIYLFLEYIRPQTLYPALDVLPFAKIILIITLLLLLLKRSDFTYVRNAASKLLILFFMVILLSSSFAMSPMVAFQMIPDFIAWMIIYFLIINIVNTEKRFIVFILFFLLYSFKMSQFSLRGWIAGGRGYSTWGFGGGPGWFQNSGEFGIQMCIYFPLAFYFYMVLKGFWPKWKMMAFALLPLSGLMGMITSSNRGTLVGGAAVIIWMFLKSRYRVKAMCAVLLVVVLSFKLIPEEQITRFQQAGEDKTSVERLDNWKKGLKMAEMYPVLGVGYKNWQIADRQFFDGNGLLSHNIFVECLSELGYAGLTVFILLIFSTFANNRETRNITLMNGLDENRFIYYMAHGLDAALIGYLVSGFFVTVLYYPYFWINLSMTVALNNIAKSRCVSHETT